MFDLDTARPISEFLRNHKQSVTRLKRTRKPQLFSVDGKPTLVIQEAASYQQLIDAIERLEAAEAIREGQRDVAAGRKLSLDAFDKRMRSRIRRDRAR